MYSTNELKTSDAQTLYQIAKRLMPGGTQLLSKRPEMFAPDVWPAYFKKAKGTKVWDLNDRQFLDMSIMSVGAAILGYADDEVDAAVIDAVRNGVVASLNCPEEVELAELLIDLHPWFDMVRYCRSGGEAMAVAVRIARARTGRDKVMFSGYHGWQDWYLAANLADDSNLDGQLMPGLKPDGVPRGLGQTAAPFDANSILSLRKSVKGFEKSIAAIVIEPARGESASSDYLNNLKDFANEIGAILIFDEITSGYRVVAGGIHRHYGISPDIAVLAKSMANGYAMSAILGKADVMEVAQSTFISSTNWTERLGPVAALTTTRKYIREDVGSKIENMGNQVKTIWETEAKKYNVPVEISGLPALASFSFLDLNSIGLNTFFTVEMLKKGILGFRQFKPSLAHDNDDLLRYGKAVSEIFEVISKGDINLESPLHHSGFKRLTVE